VTYQVVKMLRDEEVRDPTAGEVLNFEFHSKWGVS
jgi:hypothetical protein